MTHAELLRSHANLAIKEGGMYYSGEYLSRMADVAESLEAENSKLRELCVKALQWLRWAGGITCPPEVPDEFADELRELGVEVPDGD